MDKTDLTIKEALQGLEKKEFSAKELVLANLERIEKLDGKINAFLTVCRQEAIKAAEDADKAIAAREAKTLEGVPFSAKDVFSTKGIRTTASAKVLENYIPPFDATVIKRVKEAGAILIGKTNCDAWGHGSSTENSDFWPTRNPWNPEYVPGGSCGGSAAAIATGMGLFSIGEDTGGSIRQPASYCNITGLKVTYGRVSRYGAIAFASSLDTVGPMAKTVEDCAMILEIIAGKDIYDATTLPAKVPTYTDWENFDLKNLVIGFPPEYYGKGLNSEVKASITQALKIFEQLGARIVEVNLPRTKDAINTYYIIAPSETSSNLARYDAVRYGRDRIEFGNEAKRRIMLGTYALSAGYYDKFYNTAMRIRALVKEDFENAFKKVNVLVAPVAPFPPFKIGEKVDNPLAMYLTDVYSVPINLAGVPSLALPCGFTKDNLPLGMQLIGPQLSEDILFQAGHAYQMATDWHKRKAPLS